MKKSKSKIVSIIKKAKNKVKGKLSSTEKNAKDFIEEHTHLIFESANLQDFKPRVKACKMEDGILMTMQTDYEYLRAYLEYDNEIICKLFKEGKKKEIIGFLCHEVAHVITSELVEGVGLAYKGHVRYFLERQTERVGRIIYKNYTTNNKNVKS